MGLRSRMYELTEVKEVDEFLLQFPTGAFFKAGTCHKTMQGFGYVEQALDPREQIHMGFVRVVEHRPVSNYIAELTKVVHQSPQLILLVNGKVVYDVDNWNITPEALDININKHLGPLPQKEKTHAAPSSQPLPSVTAYVNLLDKYLKGEMLENAFVHEWLRTFQLDATPRPTQQFHLLNSLFGDVDLALSQKITASASTNLKQRASQLLELLKK